ncbi:hypothetical protein HII36_30520 [Nonomuraea sp. NN258]|uniref:hypothetical protein n=1 Tax=Nonomuraea antri TaxID=2730852 RepID=UPI0015699416|nr:hypothetical protein [Nonomuraea antri]NRQ36137.1 hypothetical protein [Nonomuraea antri]
MATAQELYDDLVAEHLTRPQVSVGRMLHADGLKVDGKTYAFFAGDRVILKLPAPRAAELLRDGTAEVVRMGRRQMREWVGLRVPDESVWRDLLGEAARYVETLAK